MTVGTAGRHSTDPEPAVPQVHIDNSFFLDAGSHGKAALFVDQKVRDVIADLLRERLSGQVYDPVTGTQTAKALANELRDRVHALGYTRHKLIVQVTFCQQTGQAMQAASRCLWDPANDGSACGNFENDRLICTCQVYGLYYE